MKSVIDFAKEHFNCPEIDSLPLEQQGTGLIVGSHWEKTYFSGELMNPEIEFPSAISYLTMLLLNETGWYKVDTIVILGKHRLCPAINLG